MNQLPDIRIDPLVTILMGVHNGADHLPAQLESFATQTHENWQLICSDDGSADQSPSILRTFARAHPGKVNILAGPNTGFSENYMSMIRRLPERPGVVCFADQDDIWLPDKIARALRLMLDHNEAPALYCGRRWYWNSGSGLKTASPKMTRPFSLRNALIENVASGNTILLNPAAASLARHASHQTRTVFAHDWWLYLLMTGTGGQICFDNDAPAILYRQHSGNLIGAGQGVAAQISRKIGVLQGLLSHRIDGNLRALQAVHHLLTPEAIDTLDTFATARCKSGFSRLAALHASNLYRQQRRGTLGYWGAASLGCV